MYCAKCGRKIEDNDCFYCNTQPDIAIGSDVLSSDTIIDIDKIEPFQIIESNVTLPNVNNYINQSYRAIKKGNFQKAEEVLEEAIKINPQNPLIYINKGAILFNQEKFYESARYYKTALSLSPDNKIAKTMIAIIENVLLDNTLGEIKEISLSKNAILNAVIELFKHSGLYCTAYKLKEGTISSSTGGILLGTQNIFLAQSNSVIEKEVWNPFIVKLSDFGWWKAKISILEKRKYSKSIEDTAYEYRDIFIEKELSIDNKNFSWLGLLFALPGTVLSFFFLFGSGVGAGIVSFILLSCIPYYIIKFFMIIINSRRTNLQIDLNSRINYLLKELRTQLKKA